MVEAGMKNHSCVKKSEMHSAVVLIFLSNFLIFYQNIPDMNKKQPFHVLPGPLSDTVCHSRQWDGLLTKTISTSVVLKFSIAFTM